MNYTGNKPSKALMEQAAEWYWQICEPEVTAEEFSTWQAWLHESPNHKRAFASIEAVLQQVDRAEDLPWPSEEQLLGDDYDGQVSIIDWHLRQKWPGIFLTRFKQSLELFTPKTRLWGTTVSILLMAALVSIMTQFDLWSGSDAGLQPDFALYETRTAEHRDVRLPDGSRVTLGGKSMISVAYTVDSRLIILELGAAFFEVAKDVDRPFYVQAGNRRIAAVGTAFNVTRQDDRVVVTVTEGTVIVTADTQQETPSLQGIHSSHSDQAGVARLEAGQQMTYNEKAVAPVTIADPAEATAWRDGRLNYRGESLRYVIEDVNRYATRPIALADESVAKILFTGTVFQQSIDTWLAGLEQVFPVVIEENSEGVLIHYSSPEATP